MAVVQYLEAFNTIQSGISKTSKSESHGYRRDEALGFRMNGARVLPRDVRVDQFFRTLPSMSIMNDRLVSPDFQTQARLNEILQGQRDTILMLAGSDPGFPVSLRFSQILASDQDNDQPCNWHVGIHEVSIAKVPPAIDAASLYGFSKAEAKVLSLILEGVPLDSVANDLRVSIDTVKSHLKRIYKRTGVSCRVELCTKLFWALI